MPEFLDHKSLPSDFTLRITSDWQLGSVTTEKSLIPKILEPVRKKKNYRLAFVGDIFDRIRIGDKRFSFQDFDQELAEYGGMPKRGANVTPEQAIRRAQTTLEAPKRYFEDQIASISDKILSIGIGNHEAVGMDESDPVREICERFGISYGGYTALMRVNETTMLQLWHGRPSIGSRLADPLQRNLAIKRNLVRTNQDRLLDPAVQLVAQGHTNHLVVVRPEESQMLELGFDWQSSAMTSRVVPGQRWYVCAGSLQRAFVPGRTTYVEAKGYSPLPLGCVDVIFEDSRITDVRPVVFA